MQDRIDQIKAKTVQVLDMASRLYGVSFGVVTIRFDLKGRAAAAAIRRGNQYSVRYNPDMVGREAFDHILNNSVPHEVAHLVCFARPELGNNHDAGWERVCIKLGGSGKTRHQEKVVYGKGTTYEYTTTSGHQVRVGDHYHNMVQSGTVLGLRNGMGTLNMTCTYQIVGKSGKSVDGEVFTNGISGLTPEILQSMQAMAGQFVAARGGPAAPAGPAAAQPAVNHAQPATMHGESKAAISRQIMLNGYADGKNYEEIIKAMQVANGYSRALARGTFKANYAKVGIPESFIG
jgi:predicted SprT family Zn-dependent metalloprotease